MTRPVLFTPLAQPAPQLPSCTPPLTPTQLTKARLRGSLDLLHDVAMAADLLPVSVRAQVLTAYAALTKALALVQRDDREGGRWMPRHCSICTHPQRQAIDDALTSREAFRNIAPRFRTSVTALHRHKHEHLSIALTQAQQPQDSSPPVQASIPQLSPEAWQALATYRQAAQEVERLRTQDWRRSPYAPGLV